MTTTVLLFGRALIPNPGFLLRPPDCCCELSVFNFISFCNASGAVMPIRTAQRVTPFQYTRSRRHFDVGRKLVCSIGANRKIQFRF